MDMQSQSDPSRHLVRERPPYKHGGMIPATRHMLLTVPTSMNTCLLNNQQDTIESPTSDVTNLITIFNRWPAPPRLRSTISEASC